MKNKEPKVKLIDLAPGRLFEYEGVIALKLERGGPLVTAFVVGTGVRFWPEALNDKQMDGLLVQPVSDHYLRYPMQESILSQNRAASEETPPSQVLEGNAAEFYANHPANKMWSDAHETMNKTTATGRAVDEALARRKFIRDQANHPNNRPLIVHEGPDIEGKTLTEMKSALGNSLINLVIIFLRFYF